MTPAVAATRMIGNGGRLRWAPDLRHHAVQLGAGSPSAAPPQVWEGLLGRQAMHLHHSWGNDITRVSAFLDVAPRQEMGS